MRRTRRPWTILIACGVSLAVAAACGGPDGSGSQPPPAVPSPTTSATLTTPAATPITGGALPTPTAFFDTDVTEAPSSPAAVGTPVAATGHASCATAKPHVAGDSSETLMSGGMDRTYILHIPPSYDGTRETPLVLNFHGFGSNARQQSIYSQLPPKADREGFIVVTPNGTGTPQRWNYPGLPGADDIGFVRDLLDRVEADLCIDPGWVFAAGMSNGAAFSSFVACAMPDRIAAIAPVAATTLPRTCPAGARIPIITFRGTADMCVPFEGGTSQCGQMFSVASAESAADQWREYNGCDRAPAELQFSEHVRTIAYSGCRQNTAVELWVIEGGGHTWPGSIDVPRLGTTTHEVNASDQIWEFFAAQASLR